MRTIKNALMHRKVTITKFQTISVILLLFFIVCDVFMLQFTLLSLRQLLKLYCLYFLQFIFCIICFCKNYKGFCRKMRREEKFQHDSFPLKPQPPAFLQFWSCKIDIFIGFCLYAFCSIPISFVMLEYFFPKYGIAATMLAVAVSTLFVVLGNIFQYQDTAKIGESQASGIKNFGCFVAIERVPFLKVFLKFDLIVNVVLCIYTFCTGCSASFFLAFQYPISLLIAAVSFYYTVLDVNTTLYQKRVRFNGLFRLLFLMLGGLVCMELFWFYLLLSLPFPFWSYFLAFSAITGYALFLGKFGKYPFVDYELLNPIYTFCGSDLYQEPIDLCPYCEFKKVNSQCTHCRFEGEPLFVWNRKDE